MKRARIAVALLAVAAAAVAGAAAIVFGGFYNVAATEGHSRPVERLLRQTMESSVRRQARAVEIPAGLDLGDAAWAGRFVGHYDAACATCHGAPGREPDPWMIIYPPARKLTSDSVVARWSDEELFWLLKHGIKDTGMMALGPTHDDDDIWGVTAFVRQLPHMTPEQYAALVAYQRELHESDSGHH